MFFSQQPEIVLPMALSEGTEPESRQRLLAWDNGVLKGLLADPGFNRRYTLVAISDGETTLLTYASDAILSRLSARGLEVRTADFGPWPPDEGA